ncbi:hypothetical protein FQ179_01980 [Pusillimonas sp. ANT_WB101]|nr:hypothetical protein FQ179_01980 [Pusillimonas sp. ANT_WB101]
MDADDLIWNWARWNWSGETVGNMAPYISWEDDPRPINHDHALAVDALHKALPHHESMVITAEYPQKNARFGGLHARARAEAARRWIGCVTGVWLSEQEYALYLGFFRNEVGRRLL